MLILINPLSRGYHIKWRMRLLKKFARRRKAKIVHLPTSGNMFKPIEEEIKKHKKIFIAGGDGTFESALNNPMMKNKTLGFFPLGAGNAFYWHFYKGKRYVYLRDKFPFHETEMDVLEITWDNGKRETMMLSAGIDAEVFRLGKRTKGHPFLDYLGGVFRAIIYSKGKYPMRANIDGKKKEWKNIVNIMIAKTTKIGYGFRIIPFQVEPSDGYIYGAATLNPRKIFHNKVIRLLTFFSKNLWIKRDILAPIKAKKITLESDEPFPIQAGGEFLGFTKKLRVKIKRKQKVLVI